MTATVALPPAFFDRDAVTVARALLGCVIQRPDVALRVVETEAYRGDDTACHASRGRTPRTAPLFGPPGHLYVYLCYGIHRLVNVVAEPDGQAAGVLIRGATVVAGEAVVRRRRGGRLDLIGPGKVGQALDAEVGWSGQALGGAVSLMAGRPRDAERVVAGPRVGIGYATLADQALPWRFRLVAP